MRQIRQIDGHVDLKEISLGFSETLKAAEKSANPEKPARIEMKIEPTVERQKREGVYSDIDLR